MKCLTCGAEISELDAFCENCGAKIKIESNDFVKEEIAGERNKVNESEVPQAKDTISTIQSEEKQTTIEMDKEKAKEQSEQAQKGSSRQKSTSESGNVKQINKHIFAWLCSGMFGGLGVDRFMRGQIGLGLLKLFTIGGIGVWVSADFIIALIKCYGKEFGSQQKVTFVNGKYINLSMYGISETPGRELFGHTPVNTDKRKPSKRKKKIIFIILGVIVAAAILFVGICIFSQPEDIDIEANKLGEILYTEEEEQYYEDLLHVHGYLVRDTDIDGVERYLLVSDLDNIENGDGIIFSYKDGVDKELGDYSELIVTGTIGHPKDAPSLRVLIAESIKVIKKTDRIYQIDSVKALLDFKDDLLDHKVIISGLVDRASWKTVFITDDEDMEKSVLLKNIDSDYLADMPVGYYIITGVVYLDKGNLAIDVDELELIEEYEYEDEVTEFDSPNELLADADRYDSKRIAITGWIDAAGATGYIMDGSDPIELSGITDEEVMEIYGGYCYLTGVFHCNTVGTKYSIEVEKIGY